MIAEGDRVVVRDVQGIDIVRIAGGKAVEHRGQTDMLRLMQQIGAIPALG